VTDLGELGPFPFDLGRIVEVFNRHGISYVAIGGVSGLLHGAVEHVTQDVDVMVASTRQNLQLIIEALTELGAEFDGEPKVEDFTSSTRWRTPSGLIDVMLTALGPNQTVITFQELDRYSELIEVAHGILVPTASLDDVIRMKEAADRVKDHLVLPELRRLRGDAHPERSRDVDPFEDFPFDDD
jgi:hypothetical protein